MDFLVLLIALATPLFNQNGKVSEIFKITYIYIYIYLAMIVFNWTLSWAINNLLVKYEEGLLGGSVG